jgi:hypothetical protein
VGIVNLAYTVLKVPLVSKSKSNKNDESLKLKEGIVLDWEIICLAEEGEKAKQISLTVLSKRLYKYLDLIWNRYEYLLNYVLIENQPSRLNGHMKSIQMILYSYFMYKTYHTSGTIEPLFVNASGKLQTHPEAEKNIPVCELEKGYKRNKVQSIAICQYYVRNDEALRHKISNHKKKDDLCDAMLQAIGWYHKKYKTELSCVKSS